MKIPTTITAVVCGLLVLRVPASATTRYVDVNSTNSTPPYTSWATAATNIQHAVDAALEGDEVIVTNGVYRTGGKAVGPFPQFSPTNRVVIDKPLTVRSVSGPQVTIIEAARGSRCALLQNGGFLAGFTLTNAYVGGAGGGSAGGGGVYFDTSPSSAVVSNCVIIGCTAVEGGGAASSFGSSPVGGTLVNCTFANNQATGLVAPFPFDERAYGGAVSRCSLVNCILTNNSISPEAPVGGVGGGAYQSVLENCLLVGNSSSIPWGYRVGGGAAFSSLVNCTVLQNTGGLGGGVYACSVTNSIVYDNTGGNHASNNFVAWSCTTPMPTNGISNITNAPLFGDPAYGNFRLQLNSPCINAGNNDYVTSPVDLDGKERLVGGTVDMGAYEWIAVPTHYVSLNSPNPTPPYLSWSTAAAKIQDAVDSAISGHRVLVTNGIYQTGGRFVYSGVGYGSNRLSVTKAVRVESVNGPVVTSIVGYQVPGTTNGVEAVRCAYLSSGAILAGFTLTNGATTVFGRGGGVSCESLSEVVSNCIVVGNTAGDGGGGSFRGTIQNCTLKGNLVFAPSGGGRGGGAYSGTLNNCVLIQNTAAFDGGGAYGSPYEPSYPCRLNNCSISGNRAYEGYGGGTYFATLINCTVTTNEAHIDGGGAWSGYLGNCILVGNEAGNGGGVAGGTVGVLRGNLSHCTLVGNRAYNLTAGDGAAGGVANARLYNCIVYQNYDIFGVRNYTASCSLDYSCTSPRPLAGIGNILNGPLFVDPANGNFRLQSNSPCINSGPRSSGGIDLDGNPRVVGGTVDIGAYEFQSPSSVLSYAWAQQYGFPTDGSADYSDADSDLMNNWQEWIAGTVPTDAASALRLLTPTPSGSGTIVSWQSVSNRTYFLERASDLGAQPSFSLLTNNIAGQVGLTSFTDTNAANPGPFFYRVGVQP